MSTPLRAGIVTIGSELTSGTRLDTNSAWLARRLTPLGVEAWVHRSVPDDLPAIIKAFEETLADVQVVLCTGGLGPTSDDMTRDAVAAMLGVDLVFDPPAWEAIEARFRAFGRTPSATNRRQAEFPRGARVLPTDVGTAAGFVITHRGVPIHCVPGVPREMRWMWERYLEADLRALGGVARDMRVFRCVGIAESALGERLQELERTPAVEVRYSVEDTIGTIEVRLLVGAHEGQAAAARADALEARAHELVGRHHVCATGEASLAESVGALLVDRRLTVASAESCTGGRLAAAFTAIPGISAAFLEGLVTYSNEAKTRLLGVPADIIEARGAVSQEVARAMATGVRERAAADWGVSTTGVAGPGGGSPDKPVGLVHIAVAGPGGVVHHVERRYPGDREQVQARATAGALDLLRRAVLGVALDRDPDWAGASRR
jgi:nicotinamide-nucleotide amidase